MKMDSKTVVIERSQKFEEKHFGIGNLGKVLGTLRGSMYPDPIKAICREIISNARDAHTEAGKHTLPVEVGLPNELEPTFYVKDFGVGINPDRMDNVYMQYGKSTKEDTNDEIGGWGYGAKTPFAYTDQYTLETVTPESIWEDKEGNVFENCMVKRTYILFLGENKLGSRILSNEVMTNEPQGTVIKFAVEEKDFVAFRNEIQKLCQYFPIRPVIKGVDDFKFLDDEWDSEGKDWKLSFTKSGHGFNSFIVLAGIPYKIDTDKFNDIANKDLLGFRFALFFKTGELNVTSNREELEYSEKTIKALNDKFKILESEIETKLQESIEACKNLYEAQLKFIQIHNDFGLKGATWQGLKLYPRNYSDSIPCQVTTYFKKYGQSRIRSETGSHINYTKSIALAVHDEKRTSYDKQKINTILNMDEVDKVQVISAADLERNEVEAIIHGSKLNFIKLSETAKTPLVERTPKGKNVDGKTVNYCLIKQYTGSTRPSYAWRDSTKTFNSGGIYVVNSKGDITTSIGGKSIGLHDLDNFIRAYPKVKIYSVAERNVKNLGINWISLDKYANIKYEQIKGTVKNYKNDYEVLEKNEKMYKFVNKYKALLKSKSPLVKYFEVSCAYNDATSNSNKLLAVRRVLSETEDVQTVNIDFSKLKKGVFKKYPLLKAWEDSSDYDSPVTQSEIYWYIKKKDEEYAAITKSTTRG